jgi:hypothetical protein
VALERITPEAAQTWKAGDYWALHHALGLRIWQMPDWDCDPPDSEDTPQPIYSYPRNPDTAALKAMLIEAAGPPPRLWFYRCAD